MSKKPRKPICSPAQLDRYPAKMVSKLATRLVEDFASDAALLFDPFCGSGAILHAGREAGIPVAGVDLNPYAVLLSDVKLNGFEEARGWQLFQDTVSLASSGASELPTNSSVVFYWFTS